jgi:hypothetical protein
MLRNGLWGLTRCHRTSVGENIEKKWPSDWITEYRVVGESILIKDGRDFNL